MKSVIIGAHLRRDDVEPLAEVLPVRDLFLSGFPVADDQTLGDRELLLRVAKIRAQLLDRATFIAVRYGFAASGAAEAESKVAAHLTRWKELLEAHREQVEMTMKIAATTTTTRPNRHDFASGTEYLKALHAASRGVAVEPAFRTAIDERLVPLTVKHRWLHRDEKSLEFAALVDRGRVDEVRAAGESLRAFDVAFLLSGPWPLEVFADADHE